MNLEDACEKKEDGNLIYFQGMRMRPEDLGNWTFGYIGAAVGFSLDFLLTGSWTVAGFPMQGGGSYRGRKRLDCH